MITERLLPHEVEVVHYGPGAVDDFGNPSRTEADRVSVWGRLVQTAATERTAGRDTDITDWRLILPAGTVIDAGDEVEQGGRRFSVQGAPNRVTGSFTEHHVEANLAYVEQVS